MPLMNTLPELFLVRDQNDEIVWIPGPESSHRSDGSSELLVSQAYGSTREYPSDTMFTAQDGRKWLATHAIKEGFHMEGIVLEAEDARGA